ncbi:hypothetical protein M0R45_015613 [Rubus argutus]|uniref:Ubiquitin-like protease family profile domain-containing protein n=1 Tax=Rubus argutus TaxID=59490 RepID=A0AAW1XRB5_RUBAR
MSSNYGFHGYLLCLSQMGWDRQVGTAEGRSNEGTIIKGTTDAKQPLKGSCGSGKPSEWTTKSWGSDGHGEVHKDGSRDRIDDRKRSTEPGRNSIITLCSPNDFHKTVVNLPECKVAAINDMGFGSLLRIGCPTLIEPICKMMVDNIDMENSSVLVHGLSFSLTPFKFAKTIGLAEGGYPVHIPPTISWSGKGWLQDVVCDKEGRILVSKLKDIVRHRPEVDDVFRIAFGLFVLTTILCPGNTDPVDERLVLLLMSTGEICKKDWPTFALNFLLQGVSEQRTDNNGIISGCIFFLQLMYFDIVGEGCIYVDKSIASIEAWGSLDVKELVATVQLFGGYESRSVPIKRAKRTDEEAIALQNVGIVATGVDRALREELWGVKLELASVKRDMGSVNAEVGNMHPELYGLRMTVESLVKSLAEFQEQCASIAMTRLKESGLIQTNEQFGHFKTIRKICNVRPIGPDYNSHSYGDGGILEDRRDDLQGEGPKMASGKCGLFSNCYKVVSVEGHSESHKAGSAMSACSSSPSGPPQRQTRQLMKDSLPITTRVKPHHARALFNYASNQGCRQALTEEGYVELNTNIGQNMHVAGPYKLKIALPESDVWLINFIFLGGNNFTSEEGRRVVTANRDAILYRDEISCLAPTVYVNSFVINFFSDYLNEDRSPFWFLPTIFSEQANTVAWTGTFEDWIEYTRTVCKLGRFCGRIGVCQRIFVPLHEGDCGGHWYLMVVHPMRRIAEIWDSSPTVESFNSRLAAGRSALRHLDDVFDEEHVDFLHQPSMLFGDFNIVVPDNVPFQPNGFDCGIYIIQNMQYYGTNWWAEYDSEEQRSTLLLQCVKPPVNERYDELIPPQHQPHCSAQPAIDVEGDDIVMRVNKGKKGNMGAKSNGQGVRRHT